MYTIHVTEKLGYKLNNIMNKIQVGTDLATPLN